MCPEHTKERELNHVSAYPAIRQYSVDGKSLLDAKFRERSTREHKGRQFTASSGHKKTHGVYLEGGPFFTYLTRPEINSRQVHLDGVRVNDRIKYDGPVNIPVPTVSTVGSVMPDRDDSYLDQYGATAIRIVDPSNPNANLGESLGEIVADKRISLPGIQSWKRRTEIAKAAGSEYLSAVFGWLPLISEVKSTAQSVRDGNTIMRHYRDNAGTNVHREFEFDVIESQSESLLQNGALFRCTYSGISSISAFQTVPGVPIIVSRKSTTRRWFSGSFTYAATQASSLGYCLGLESEADKLYGLTLTPDVLWELVPWSWAIDWFSNTGDVIHNAVSLGASGLVMRYGYIMEETSIVDTYSMPATGLTGVDGPPPNCSITHVIKRRRPANPFGFGLSWEGLSSTQQAIIAALGITRL
jgi:hypothetical protein